MGLRVKGIREIPSGCRELAMDAARREREGEDARVLPRLTGRLGEGRELRLQGLVFGVWGLGFRVWGLGLRV